AWSRRSCEALRRRHVLDADRLLCRRHDRQPIRPAGLEVRRDQARGIGLTQLRHGRHHTATLETVVSDPSKARSEVESSAKGLAVALRSRGRARTAASSPNSASRASRALTRALGGPPWK